MASHRWKLGKCLRAFAGRLHNGLLILLFAVAGARGADAQSPAPQADPQDFGLLLPDSPPQPGANRRVVVNDSSGKAVVARVHVEVGDRYVVLLPNGRLDSIAAAEATPTDRPFAAASAKQILAELTKEKFKGFKTRSTKHYAYVYNASQPFFQGASKILETMYPNLVAYCDRQKLGVHDPDVPMVVVMFRTQQEFDAYHKMPEGVVAYYNSVTNHVVMYEQSELANIAPDLAVKQSISTIAHEGVHQILHNIGVQQRLSRWPMWISEGLPEFFAPTRVDERIRWQGVGEPNDLRMYTLQEHAKGAGAAAAAGSQVEQTVRAEQLDSLGYATAWAMTHFLAKQRSKDFFAYLKTVSGMQPLEQRTGDDAELFVKQFGDDFAGLEKGMLKNLQKLPYLDPIANQTHWVALLDTRARRMLVVTTSPAAVQQWHQEALAKLPPNERDAASLSVQAFPNKTAAEQFARSSLGQ